MAGHDETGQARGQVQDAAAVGDQRQQGLREEEHALQVHVHQQVELFFRGLGEGRMHAEARVVDQEVEALAPPGLRQRVAHLDGEGGEAAAVADVELQGQRAPAQGLDLRHRVGGVGSVALVGQQHIGALGCQRQGGVAALAAAAAGDEGDRGGGGSGHGGLRFGCGVEDFIDDQRADKDTGSGRFVRQKRTNQPCCALSCC